MILVDSSSPSGSQCSVAVDDVLGGDVAVSHLLASGHHDIAYVGGPLNLRQEALGTDAHQHRQVIFQPELEIRRSSQGPPRAAQRPRRQPAIALSAETAG